MAGYFRFVPPLDLNIYYDRRDPSFSESVMFHEANHYLQKLIRFDFSMPHWPGESLAEYYGASKYDSRTGKLEVGLIQEGRLTEIQTDIAAGEMMGLEKLLTADRMYEHYNWGWSLVHFLMNHSKYKKKFQKYVQTLAQSSDVRREKIFQGKLETVRGDECWRVFRKQLGLKSDSAVKKLEESWHGYIEQNLELVTARGFEKAGFAAAGGYPSRPLRAERLLRTAVEKGSTNALVYHKLGEFAGGQGRDRGRHRHVASGHRA